jgi:hypothetical protein
MHDGCPEFCAGPRIGESVADLLTVLDDKGTFRRLSEGDVKACDVGFEGGLCGDVVHVLYLLT